MTYTRQRLQEMGSIEIWCVLALHKGRLGEQTKYTNKGTDTEKAYHFTYFYLGRDDVVGVDDGRCRRAMEASLFVTQEWYDQLGTMNPHAPWEGPEPLAYGSAQAYNRMREDALPALKLLNGGTSKPKLKLKTKPQRYIAYEDRPDVGVDVTAKRGFKLRKPGKFKLKGRSS